MATLMSQPGRIFSRSQLLNAVRGVAFESYERAIDSHIRNLRRKLEPGEYIDHRSRRGLQIRGLSMHTNTVRAIRNRLLPAPAPRLWHRRPVHLLVILATTALVLFNPSQSNPLFSLPIISRLETYYLARGSWDGVTLYSAIPTDFETRQWRRVSCWTATDHRG